MDDDQKLLAQYANWFNIGHNNFEFIFDFGQHHAELGNAIVHTRIVVGPAYAKVFGKLLMESLSRFEESYGALPDHSDEEPQQPC